MVLELFIVWQKVRQYNHYCLLKLSLLKITEILGANRSMIICFIVDSVMLIILFDKQVPVFFRNVKDCRDAHFY